MISDGAVVAGRRHDDRTKGTRRRNCIGHRLAEAVSAPTVVDDVGAVFGSVKNPLDQIRVEAPPVGAQPAHGHDTVVSDGRHRSRHVCTVTVTISRICISVVKVPPYDVIDEAVAIIVDAVAGNLNGIRPDIGGQVRMREIDPGIDYRHGHTLTARQIPGAIGLRQVEAPKIGIGLAPCPHCREKRIVGNDSRPPKVVGLGVLDRRVGLVALCGLQRIDVGRDLDQNEAGEIGGAQTCRCPRGALWEPATHQIESPGEGLR